MRLSRAHKDGSCRSLPSSAGPEAWFGLCSEPCPRRPIQVEVDGAGTGDGRAPAPGCELGSASAQGMHQGGCDGRKELAQLPPNQSPRSTLAGNGLEAAMASGLGLSADLRSGPSASSHPKLGSGQFGAEPWGSRSLQRKLPSCPLSPTWPSRPFHSSSPHQLPQLINHPHQKGLVVKQRHRKLFTLTIVFAHHLRFPAPRICGLAAGLLSHV